MRLDESIIGFLRKKKECDEVVVRIYSDDSNLSRFGLNRITQNMSRKIVQITVKAIKGSRVGSAVTTRGDMRGLLAALKNAERMAATMPEDPEFVPPLDPQQYHQVSMMAEETAKITPLAKAKKILGIVERAEKEHATVAGYFSNGTKGFTVMNTRGLYCSQNLTDSAFSITVKIGDASGFAEASHEDVKRLDIDRLYATAHSKAVMGKNPLELPAGEYPVILEPLAMGELLFYLQYLMDKRSADEGWSFFAKKEGKRIAAPFISIFSDPEFGQCPGIPFDFQNEGIPLKKQVWIRNGVLKKLWTDRYWAKKKGIKATGMPLNLIIMGSGASVGDVVAKVHHGLLITRLWYIRFVNRKELILTGMTRDGLFLIEDGKISKAVKNMRFNDSPFTLLKSAKRLGKSERVAGRFYVPALFAAKFNFASATKF
jgi:predicted Zn-dependent protease